MPAQLLHRDVCNSDHQYSAPYMFIGLVAMEEGVTKMRACAYSHNVFKHHKPEHLSEVQLDKYQYFVGHPFLIHSGCSSSKYNLRLHFYHGYPDSVGSQTELVDEESLSTFIFDRKNHLHDARKKSANRAKRDAKRRKCY